MQTSAPLAVSSNTPELSPADAAPRSSVPKAHGSKRIVSALDDNAKVAPVRRTYKSMQGLHKVSTCIRSTGRCVSFQSHRRCKCLQAIRHSGRSANSSVSSAISPPRLHWLNPSRWANENHNRNKPSISSECLGGFDSMSGTRPTTAGFTRQVDEPFLLMPNAKVILFFDYVRIHASLAQIWLAVGIGVALP